MIRTLLTSALSLLLIGFLAAPTRAAGPEDAATKDDVKDINESLKNIGADLRRLIEDHKKLSMDFAKDKAEKGIEIDALKDRLQKLDKYTSDAVTDLSKKIDDLNRRLDKVTGPGGRPAFTIDPTMGRLNLVNSWDFPVTFNVDNRRYVLAPQQQQVVDVPAGRVMYEIVSDGYGVIHPLQPLDIRPGQALTMQVFRK